MDISYKMKAICKLLARECKYLRLPAIISIIALILFTSSLFAIVSVYINLSDGVFAAIDNDGKLSFSAYNICWDELITRNTDGLLYGHKKGLTHDTALISENGRIFITDKKTETTTEVSYVSRHGIILFPTMSIISASTILSGGELPLSQNEICLSDLAANELGVKIGDIIYIDNHKYVITGTYLKSNLEALPYYIVNIESSIIMDDVTISLKYSSDTYSLYNKLYLQNKDVNISPFYEQYFHNLSLINALLMSSAVVLFITNMIIIYSLYSIIIINRKHFIGRLLLLGYKETHIFGIYFSILTVITFTVNVVASLLANLIGTSIIATCSLMFGINIDPSFPWWVSVINLLATVIVALPLYFANVKHIRKISLHDSMRCD